MVVAAAPEPDRDPEPPLHAGVYDEMRRRMITGKITAGGALSTRRLALEMGVIQTPVRDAISRLAAEGAVTIRSKRRLEIPPMSRERFADLLACRLLLEPEAAVLALRRIDEVGMNRLRKIDDSLHRASADNDVANYMESDFEFHFEIYRASGRETLNRLIEALWLQFGPFLRMFYEQHRAPDRPEQRRRVLAAIARRDGPALREAVAREITDGMGLIGKITWRD